MKKILFMLALLASVVCQASSLERPKLVVGVVVDQMRWDYLYRYYDKFRNDGLKRLIT